MSKLLLKSVSFNNMECDIVISENRFVSIDKPISEQEAKTMEILDCKRLAIMPAFYNAHTHAAMTLLRGYADDKPLFEWLKNYIWPFEAKLTADDIEIGSRLAALEMIKSGTVFFADMYYHRERTMKVVEEMGMRAAIGVTISDQLLSPENLKKSFDFLKRHTGESERIRLVVMPHSLYTVSKDYFKKCVAIAKEEHYNLHTHLAETKTEVTECLQKYHCTPVELLEQYNALDSSLIAAHCVHFSEHDTKLFAQSGATIVTNPCSNLKLRSGIPPICSFFEHHIPVALGTDGASSNNNLDMHEEMKTAGLLAKAQDKNGCITNQDILHMATEAGAKAYGIQAGKIAEGYLADCILIKQNNERLVPCHDMTSNWIYSANNSAIDTVICNGKCIMRHNVIDGEEDIVREAKLCTKRILQRL